MKKKIFIIVLLILTPALCTAALRANTLSPSVAPTNLQPVTGSANINNSGSNTVAPSQNINIKVSPASNGSNQSGNVANPPAGNTNKGAIAPSTQINKNSSVLNPGALNGIVILDPAGGEEYEMNGIAIQVYFKFFGIDKTKTGLKYNADLLKGGKVLGLIGYYYGFDLDVDKGYENFGYTPGWYADVAQDKMVQAPEGNDYSVRVRIMDGDKVVMEQTSNQFSFVKNSTKLPPLSLKVMSPNGGEEFAKDGKVISGYFNYAGLDPNVAGTPYTFKVELWRYGKRLGYLSNPYVDLALSPSATNENFGWQSGVYLNDADSADLMAPSGGGYQIKVIFYKDGKEIISDMGDGTFSYKDGPVYTGVPAVKMLTPNGGEYYNLGKDATIEINFTGFNPYDGGKITYKLYVIKGGKNIGTLFPDWMDTVVNMWVPKETIYTSFNNYYDSDGKSQQIISASDYKLEVDVIKDNKVILQDQSDNNFTISQESGLAKLMGSIFGVETKIQAPVEMQPAISNIVAQNKNVAGVKIYKNNVEIKYTQPAKLLGVIPVNYNLKINADVSKKTVSVQKPWWLFLTSNNSKMVSRLSNQAINNLQDISDMTSFGQLQLQKDMQEKQQFVETISNVMKEESDINNSLDQNLK